MVEPEPLSFFTDVSRDKEHIGEVFRVVETADEVDGQTHKIDLRIDGHLWWVYDNQIEVLDYEEEK